MAVKIYGNTIQNCGTGISIPKDADVEIGTNNIIDCNIAIELRDPPSFIECLGLRKDTPIDKVLQVLNVLTDEKVQKSEIEEKIKNVGLLDWLSATANASTVINAFYQLVTSSYVQQAIALLSK
jgi:hypothetical protein